MGFEVSFQEIGKVRDGGNCNLSAQEIEAASGFEATLDYKRPRLKKKIKKKIKIKSSSLTHYERRWKMHYLFKVEHTVV